MHGMMVTTMTVAVKIMDNRDNDSDDGGSSECGDRDVARGDGDSDGHRGVWKC